MTLEKEWDVVLLTESRYENPREENDYIANILKDDRILIEALESKGLRVIRKDWADPDFDWTSIKIALFRTTWDYFDRWKEFFDWFQKTKSLCTFVNSHSTVLWNTDKIYLNDLKNAGVNIVDTLFINRDKNQSLSEVLRFSGWDKAVLKPNISGAGRHTYLIDKSNVAEYEAVYKDLITNENMLLQDYQKSITEKGEVSHMVINGQYTHSILKIAKKGDFRVQDDFGGTVHDYQAKPEEIAFAELVVKASKRNPLYARVDVVWDNNNALALSELELIEPELWFRHHPPAAYMLAEGLMKEFI